MEEPSCTASTRVKRNNTNHTINCGKPAGHDGAHEARDVGSSRSVMWYGRADVALPGDTRWRYVKPPKFDAKAYTRSFGGHGYSNE